MSRRLVSTLAEPNSEPNHLLFALSKLFSVLESVHA